MTDQVDLAGIARRICERLGGELRTGLGSGRFKQAFLVVLPSGPAALKIAPIPEGMQERFERETAALRGCSHPAISKLVDAFAWREGGHVFWVNVEELLPGGTFADRRAKAGRFTCVETRQLGVPLADALIHLEERRLVHRDIKPANILFRSSSEPVLTDFGLVRVLDAPSLTHDMQPQGPGTPLYSAPEQLNNDKQLIDSRTDQFGLALVLAEAFLGFHPFSPPAGKPLDAVLAMQQRRPIEVRAASELREAGLECLVTALSPWPVSRFRTAVQFAAALRGTK